MLSRLERVIERAVEGSVARVFRLHVQPAEIGRRLERAMLDGRVTSVGAILGPNAFQVRLHPDDAAAFTEWDEALARELESWLAELAFARGITTVGPIRVELRADTAVKRRSVVAAARFDDEPRTASRGRPASVAMLRLMPQSPEQPEAVLDRLPLTVGRANDNDLVLAHPEVSRHHARLEPEGPVWRIVDLGSTNGTWLNGARITSERVGAGDALAFGSLRFTLLPG